MTNENKNKELLDWKKKIQFHKLFQLKKITIKIIRIKYKNKLKKMKLKKNEIEKNSQFHT